MIRLDRNCHHTTPSEGNNPQNYVLYVHGGAKNHWLYLNYISLSSPTHLIPSCPTLFVLVVGSDEAGHCRSLQNNEWGRRDMKLRLKMRDE